MALKHIEVVGLCLVYQSKTYCIDERTPVILCCQCESVVGQIVLRAMPKVDIESRAKLLRSSATSGLQSNHQILSLMFTITDFGLSCACNRAI